MSSQAVAGDEHSLLAAFVAVLELEEQALLDGDPDSIASLAREKSAYLDRLVALRPCADPSPALRCLRDRARLANERNGRLISLRLARVRERLDVLSGMSDAGPAYGADGYARACAPSPNSQRSLG